MEIKIVQDKISISELQEFAEKTFGNLVKAVVDIEKKIMAMGGEMHTDEEKILLESGSLQNNLWGINIYPSKSRDNWIEFDSMINLRPSFNNFSRGIDNPEIQKIIKEIVEFLIE